MISQESKRVILEALRNELFGLHAVVAVSKTRAKVDNEWAGEYAKAVRELAIMEQARNEIETMEVSDAER